MNRLISNVFLIVSFIALIFCLNGYAQENYLEGYIVNSSNDTIKGSIDYRDWHKNPTSISFKNTLGSKASVFNPLNIQGFEVDGNEYLSGIVTVDKSLHWTGHLGYSQEIDPRTDTVFLQKITSVGHEKSLYYYTDRNGKEHFFITEDSKFILLKYKKYLKKNNGSTMVNENKKYLNQLIYYFHEGCPSITKKINRSEYSKSGLEGIFETYAACIGMERTVNIEKTRKYEVGVFSGMLFSNVNYSGNPSYITDANWSNSPHLCLGVSFNTPLPTKTNKLFYLGEIQYSNYKSSGDYETTIVSNPSFSTYELYNSEIGFSYMKLNQMLRWKFPLNKWFYFVNPGLSLGLRLSETNFLKFTRIRNSGEPDINSFKAIKHTRSITYNYTIGMGIGYHKYSVEVRLERGAGHSALPPLNSGTNNLYIILRYRLF